ncbi:hypothetical protein Fmac_020933 [Flemingia macrophylla]|uniref:AAA+ ATPase domain-containing protein n=1 Tax=Flemingia macrophylla TaxID=520843 RepID=A0ABD1LVG7_9FABA
MRKRGSSQTLLRRVEAMYPANMHPTTDEVVERLRSTYPDYSRTKHQALFRSVQSVLQSTRKREGFGLDLSTGFLLYGPPGCGKTLVAKAVANAAGGPDILNEYVGVSEKKVRKIFDDARTCAPCILFYDELDALTTTRGKGKEGASVTDRVLNQLLIELDGAEQRKDVFVIGATNRPEVIDSALLRPARLGRLLYVPLPSPEQWVLILKNLARKHPVDVGSYKYNEEYFWGLIGFVSIQMEEVVMAAVKKYRTSSNGKEKAIRP